MVAPRPGRPPDHDGGSVPPASRLVDLTGIEFSYGTLQVLFGVTMRVARGEIVGLLGTNGAGKSTLLRVLAGLASPTAGRVVLDGEDVTGRSVVEMVERGVVLLPGGKAVFPDMTVVENLDVGAYSLPRGGTLVTERIERVLELFPGLADRRRQRAGSLSGGEQQQLALAKALLLEPAVLLIDELSLGLAPRIIEVLLGVVEALHEQGTTIVLAEQSLNVAALVCERVVFMEKGDVRFEGTPTDLLDHADIARAVFFGGREVPAAR